MKLITGLLLLLCLALCASAADVSGKWAGTVEFKLPDGSTNSGGAYGDFKQNGQTVTGTGGPEEQPDLPIENGRIEGTKLTLQVTMPGDPPRVFKVALTLIGDDKLEGNIEGAGESGVKMAGKMTLLRKK